MHPRKSNRRYIVVMAVSLSLLTMFGPQTAMAQFIPGMPVGPTRPPIWMPPPVKSTVTQAEQMPIMYTDMNVTARRRVVAQPHELTSKAQYTLAANLLDTRVHVLRALNQENSMEMVAALNNLGWMQEHVGLVGSAQRSYLQALKILNKRAPAYATQAAVIEYNLAELYMGEHRFLDALACYRAALQDLRSVQNPDQRAVHHVQQKYDVVRRLILASQAD